MHALTGNKSIRYQFGRVIVAFAGDTVFTPIAILCANCQQWCNGSLGGAGACGPAPCPVEPILQHVNDHLSCALLLEVCRGESTAASSRFHVDVSALCNGASGLFLSVALSWALDCELQRVQMLGAESPTVADAMLTRRFPHVAPMVQVH